jgi:ABC-2 type transport system permease protein
MIQVTLTAMPRRPELLAAKTLVLTGPLLVASALAVGGCMFAGWLILPGHWFTAAALRAAFCSVVYLTLIAVLSLGVTTMVRDTAVAAGVTLGLLFAFPIVITLFSDHTLVRHLEQISPLFAGQDVQSTTGLSSLPLSPWPALGVVALWAAGSLAAGLLLFQLRDA